MLIAPFPSEFHNYLPLPLVFHRAVICLQAVRTDLLSFPSLVPQPLGSPQRQEALVFISSPSSPQSPQNKSDVELSESRREAE